MALVPNSRTAKVAFFKGKIAPWTTNAVAIGTSAAEVTAHDAKVTAAENALAAQVSAAAASKTATMIADNAVDALANAGADIIRQIRAKAEIVGNSVYELAQIPAPAIPSPTPAPGMPYGFVATLLPNGSLELTWKCDNPPRAIGVIYNVWRKNADGTWNSIGGAGQKKFVDTTVPAGVPSVIYSVQAMRSTGVGVSNEFTVNFGVSGGGGMTASVAQPKLAA
jgi:hypothetical protein